MPFPNEHAARQKPPGNYTRFRRGSLPGAPKGVSAIFGIKPNGKSEVQSLRFSRSNWTADKARAWLKRNGFKTGGFEPASPAKKGLWEGTL